MDALGWLALVMLTAYRRHTMFGRETLCTVYNGAGFGEDAMTRYGDGWATVGAVASAVLAASLCLASPPRTVPKPLGFNREIRPILAESCFTCHGPDRATRQANLRLDRSDDALVRAILVPGKPEKSPLIARIDARGALQMPPASSHKALTAAQKNTLRRWVAEGARYEPHWAFVPPPAAVPVPAVKKAAWPRGPIDRFVLARLEKEALAPSPEASRTDWLRRVSFDLNGLPPSVAELDAFLADPSPKAYETVVDRLLASPRYGERLASGWLDLARYADSYGYQSDQLSPTWPYRDWVVRAFNRNLPYNRFVTEQLAGDLLPGATREERLATTFNRLHRMTNEGGSVAEEWRMEYVADRVRTIGTAFLGLTTECARCHDHKYDPISQKDYYGLAAFFNSIDEHGLYNQADIVPTPSLLLPTPEQERALTAAHVGVAAAEAALTQARDGSAARFAAWRALPAPTSSPDRVVQVDFEKPVEGVNVGTAARIDGPTGKAAQLDGDSGIVFPQQGRFTRHTPFTIALRLRDPGITGPPAVVFQACDGTDSGFHGYDLILENGVLTARLFRHWPGNAIAVRAKRVLPRGVWSHVAVTYDGSSRAAGLEIAIDGQSVPVERVRDHLSKGIGEHTLIIGQRFRDRGFKGGRVDDIAIFSRVLSPLERMALASGAPLDAPLATASTEQARATFEAAFDPELRAARAALAVARARVWQAEDPQMEVPSMEELPRPRPTFVLARGRYDAPQDDATRVGRQVPAAILAFPADLPADRLGFARWLTRPDHPLTARVQVNRLWALCFGRGLVETSEDFGVQGRPPSHPELLDWLARDYIRSGWDTKRLLKTLVLSATYRQASALRPILKARDPQNVLLARGPSYRLSGEEIRDLALAAGGLLDERRGGPPVSPYQPGDLWRETNTMSPAYQQSVGTDLYRRSLYSVWKRTAPLPNLLAFDAVSREVCVARRQNTSTPLQAFVLLNDPQFVEAARALGARALREGGATTSERVRFVFRTLAARAPTDIERRALTGFADRQYAFYQRAPEEAKRLIAVGASTPDPSLPADALAAATVLAQAVLNLDAAIWKR
jgi:hypothetical protein